MRAVCALLRGEGALGSALRPGTPRIPFLPRPLCEGPAHAEPAKVAEEKDVGSQGHSLPLLQRGLHLPCALQPDPGGLPGGRVCGPPPLGAQPTAVFLFPHVPRRASAQSVDLVLAVWARGPQFRAEPVGKVLLGARASGQPLQHWADMLAHARRPVAQWHPLRPAREVDRALGLKPRLHLTLPGSRD